MPSKNQGFTILSYLQFDYSKDRFLASYKGEATNHQFALGFVHSGQSFLKPDVLLYSTPEEKDNFHFSCSIDLDAEKKVLKDLHDYLTNNEDTNLLTVIFGHAENEKKETGHVLMVTASEGLGDNFILSKGERVAKGERVFIDKGGQRVSIEVGF